MATAGAKKGKMKD